MGVLRAWLCLVEDAKSARGILPVRILPVRILIVVHPDSACGSADWNLGEDRASKARQSLIADLNQWHCGVIVLFGADAGDLRYPAYAPLAQALTRSLHRARAQKQIAIRRKAPDPMQIQSMREIIQSAGLQPGHADFELTGAWYHSKDGTGCVGDLKTTLQAEGFAAGLRQSVLDFDHSDAR